MNASILAQLSVSFAGLFDQAAWEATLQNIALHVPQILTGLLLVVVFWTVARVVRGLVLRVGSSRRVNADAVHIIADAIKWSVLTIGLITGLGTIGIDVSALVAGLGLTGLALGIALKDVVSNSIAGIMILIYKPFQRQDRIVVTGLEGTVAQIDLRFTTLEVEDRRILIPNSNLLTNSIVVYRRAATAPLSGETD
jgi:small-conductance mechanosensitive channel